MVGLFFADLPETTLSLTVDAAECIDPLSLDGALAHYPILSYVGQHFLDHIYLRDTARIQIAARKGLKASDLRKNRDTGLIEWGGSGRSTFI